MPETVPVEKIAKEIYLLISECAGEENLNAGECVRAQSPHSGSAGRR
jgi:hypothetical protein